MSNVFSKIKGWFYREKVLPGSEYVYTRVLCFAFLSRKADARCGETIETLLKRKQAARWIPIPSMRNKIRRECDMLIQAENQRLEQCRQEQLKKQRLIAEQAAIESDIRAWGDNIVEFRHSDRSKFELHIKGRNNRIKIGALGHFGVGKLKLHVYGDNNELIIGNNVRGHDLYIRIGEPYTTPTPTHHGKVQIGNNLNVVGAWIHLLHSHSSIIIGDDCLFSFGVQIRNTDGHPIYEKGSREPINRVGDLILGNHVWVGHSVSITKSAKIANDCVVGCNSVVCKTFEEPNCAIAGNPARVVRRNIEWEAHQTANFLENT